MNKRRQSRDVATGVSKAAALRFDGTFRWRNKVEEFTEDPVVAGYLDGLENQNVGVSAFFKAGRSKSCLLSSLVPWVVSRLEVQPKC